MNALRASALVERLQAVWPHPEWPIETCGVYVEYFESFDDPDLALLAVKRCERSCKWRPSIAELDEAWRAIVRELQVLDDLARPALEAGPFVPAPVEVVEEALSEARAALDRARAARMPAVPIARAAVNVLERAVDDWAATIPPAVPMPLPAEAVA